MYVSFIQLILPFDLMLKAFFFRKTGRRGAVVDGFTLLDIALFFCVVIWVFKFYTLGVYDRDNLFHSPTMGQG